MKKAQEFIEKSMIEHEGNSYVFAPYNADPITCHIYLKGEIPQIKYNDKRHIGMATNSVRAEIAAGMNMFARMFEQAKAQEAYIHGLLEIHSQSQEQLAKRFEITRAIVVMGPIYLASHAMKPDHEHHFMAREQLINLPKNLQTLYDHYKRLTANPIS